MSKPPVLVWASDSVYASGPTAGASNKVAPANAAVASGYFPDEEPTAEVWNHLMHRAGLWTAYLSDGALEGDHSVDGALAITGAATVGGDLDVAGAASVAGDVYHGDRPLTISASSFVPAGTNSATSPSLYDYWTFTGGPPGNVVQAGILLPVGRRIRSVEWHFNKAGSTSPMTFALRKRNGATNAPPIDTFTDTASGASWTSEARSAIDYTVAAGDAMFLRVDAGSTLHEFSHAIVTYDFPAP